MDLGSLVTGLLTGTREGVEAALIVSIILVYLARTGNRRHFGPIWLGAGAAVVLSIVVGAVLWITIHELPSPAEQPANEERLEKDRLEMNLVVPEPISREAREPWKHHHDEKYRGEHAQHHPAQASAGHRSGTTAGDDAGNYGVQDRRHGDADDAPQL